MQKRRAIFDHYRLCADILCFQETHSTIEHENIWRNEWGGRIIFAHGTAKARGTCILFQKKLTCNIKNIKCDEGGRFVCCEIEIGDKNWITIASVYGPNNDLPQFFSDMGKTLEDYAANKVIVGDFNLVMDVKKDRRGSRHNNVQAVEALKNVMNTYSLNETWRSRNEHILTYSWLKSKQPNCPASRLDFGLVSRGMENLVENPMYITGLYTDHMAFYMSIAENLNKRGVGYWKLNSSLLLNHECLEKVKDKVQRIVQVTENLCPIERWDQIKRKSAQYLKELSRNNATDEKIVLAQLAEKLGDMEGEMPLNKFDTMLYHNTKADLEKLQLNRTHRLIFRSRATWYAEGERSTRYFFNLERARFNARTCSTLLTEEGTLLTRDEDILNEQLSFYKELYKKEEEVNFDLINENDICISEHDKVLCRSDFTGDEFLAAIKQLKNNKTPGEDGLTAEFYKLLWPVLKDPFIQMTETCYKKTKDTSIHGERDSESNPETWEGRTIFEEFTSNNTVKY